MILECERATQESMSKEFFSSFGLWQAYEQNNLVAVKSGVCQENSLANAMHLL